MPRRPQLTYSVAQRRAIVEGLVADLENARYTDRAVRYRSGLSALPPPPPPPQWQVAEVATAQAEALVPEAPAKPLPSEQDLADAPDVAEEGDIDDSLDEFVHELAEESLASTTDDDATLESPGAQDQSPWREPRTIVGWWEQWFGGESDDAPPQEGAGDVGPPPAAGAGVEPVIEPAEDEAVVRAAAMVLQAGGKTPESETPEDDGGDRSPPASHGGGALGGAATVLPANRTLGTPARLIPSPFWPTSPATLPSPRKPLVVVVQPIPEPSVPIDVENGLLAVPAAPGASVDASARLESDGAGLLLVQAER